MQTFTSKDPIRTFIIGLLATLVLAFAANLYSDQKQIDRVNQAKDIANRAATQSSANARYLQENNQILKSNTNKIDRIMTALPSTQP